jgi:hypothetical protein
LLSSGQTRYSHGPDQRIALRIVGQPILAAAGFEPALNFPFDDDPEVGARRSTLRRQGRVRPVETRLAVDANFRKRVIRLPIRKLRTSRLRNADCGTLCVVV